MFVRTICTILIGYRVEILIGEKSCVYLSQKILQPIRYTIFWSKTLLTLLVIFFHRFTLAVVPLILTASFITYVFRSIFVIHYIIFSWAFLPMYHLLSLKNIRIHMYANPPSCRFLLYYSFKFKRMQLNDGSNYKLIVWWITWNASTCVWNISTRDNQWTV